MIDVNTESDQITAGFIALGKDKEDGTKNRSSPKWANSKAMCAVLCAASGIITILTWEGWISLLPFGGTIASTVGGFSHNPRTIRMAGMFFNSPLWVVYDVIVGSWAGIVDEVVTEISIVISRRYTLCSMIKLNPFSHLLFKPLYPESQTSRFILKKILRVAKNSSPTYWPASGL